MKYFLAHFWLKIYPRGEKNRDMSTQISRNLNVYVKWARKFSMDRRPKDMNEWEWKKASRYWPPTAKAID